MNRTTPGGGGRVGNTVGAGRTFVAERLLRPAQAFVRTEASSGLVLLAATIAALIWANSPWDSAYHDLWDADLSLDLSLVDIHDTLREAVNEGLMAVFFFVVGLEIKRELVEGELASVRRAALPVAAALGGMILPAAIFMGLNGGREGGHGWGIPMATDIAFALGVLTLLGRRVPFALKVFVLAFAIVDDLGAIVVIAVFYADNISYEALAWAALVLALIVVASRAGLRSTDAYVVLGALLWVAVFKSGVHATIAGVVLAALTPTQPLYRRESFEDSARRLVDDFAASQRAGDFYGQQAVMSQLESLSRDSESPLDRLERVLHPWVSYLVVPVFALANAGVVLSGDTLGDAASSRVTAGIALGLVVGKPLGILLFSWLAVRLGVAALPVTLSFVHILGAGLLGGIGFTVSLFITGLAFENGALVTDGKVGILVASLIAGTVGFAYLWLAPGEPTPAEPG